MLNSKKIFTVIIVYFLCLGIGSLAMMAILKNCGIDLENLGYLNESVTGDFSTNCLKLAIGTNHLISFILSGLIITYILSNKNISKFLGLHIKFDWSLFLKFLFCLVISLPILSLIVYGINQLPLPSWATDVDNNQLKLMSKLLTMDSFMDLFANIIIIALFAGIGEELIFRGILQKSFYKLMSPTLSIWIAAILFGIMHFEVTGLLPKIFLGAVMGYAYYYTGNILVPIIIHSVNNGMQVSGLYISKAKPEDLIGLDQEISVVNIGIGIICLGILIGLAQHIHNQYKPAHGSSV